MTHWPLKDYLDEIIKQGDRDIEVLAAFDLSRYDHDMSLLYHELKSFLATRFADAPAEFAPNQRIVFLHQDSDFFIDPWYPPLTLYNLQLILRELDISNCFCTVITNLLDYDRYTRLVQEKLSTDDFAMRSVTSLEFVLVHVDHSDRGSNIGLIDRSFCLHSRAQRFHRTYFVSELFRRNLQNQGYVLYHNISQDSPRKKDTQTTIIKSPECPCFFLYSHPFRRDNLEIVIRDHKSRLALPEFTKNVPRFTNIDEDVDVNDRILSLVNNSSTVQKALIFVGLETTATCPATFLSSITFKGILQRRPFVIFGSPGIIERLKNDGFQTFDRWWSEDYSSEPDIEKRAAMILDILEHWAKKSVAEIQAIADEMQPVLDHNFRHYVDQYKPMQTQKLLDDL